MSRKQQIFISPDIFSGGRAEILDEKILRQLKKVLRIKVGFEFVVANGKGKSATAKVIKIDKKCVAVDLRDFAEKKSGKVIDLFVALPKNTKRAAFLIEKAAELGARRVFPVLSSRAEFEKLNLERLNEIAREAGETAYQKWVCEVFAPVSFGEAVEMAGESEKVVFLDISDEKSVEKYDMKNLAIFVGPAGGWDKNEVLVARNAGFEFVSFGEKHLRTETAAIVVLSKLI